MNPTILYAAASSGLFRSVNGGRSWSLLFAGPPIFTFALDPRDDRHLILVPTDRFTLASLQESKDGGESWTSKQLPPVPPFSGGVSFSNLAIDPFDGNTFYASATVFPFSGIITRGALYKSVDAGGTWTEVLSAGLRMSGVAFDHSTPGTLFVGAWGSGAVWKSTDGGNTWSRSQVGDLPWVGSVTADPSNPSVLYTVVGGLGLFKTTDAGQTWFSAGNGIDPPYSVASVVLAPSKSREVFANTSAGVYRSEDGAASWRLFAPKGNTVLAVDPVDAEVIYLQQRNHLLRSDDGGRTLRDASTGLFASTVHCLLADPQSSSVLYAGGSGEFFSTSDGASTWTWIVDGLPSDNAMVDLALDPRSSSVLYAAVDGSVFKSVDRGLSWNPSSSGLVPPDAVFPPAVLSIAADQGLPGVLYIVTGSGVFRSDDGAASWKKLDFPAAHIVRTDPKTAGTVYVASFDGVFKSTDFGATWRRRGDFAGVYGIAVDSHDGSRIYATTTTTIFRSSDGGATWSPAVSGPTLPTSAIAADPTRPERIYTISSSTVFQSLDGGANWISISSGLPQTFAISSLAVGPTGLVYLGTGGLGVFSFQPIPDRPLLERIDGPRRVRSLGSRR